MHISSKENATNLFLATGSNIGDRLLYLHNAQKILEQKLGLSVASPIYETEPWGYTEQASFLNQVLGFTCQLTPDEVFAIVQQTEQELGKIKKAHWAERNIDIDFILYGANVVANEAYILPHARMAERRFVLQPLFDIAPQFVHPILHKTIADLLIDCTDVCTVKKYS